MFNEKSCGAVVFAKTPEIKFLLLQYDAGHWDFVKGNVELSERETDTVVRELGEETGIVDACFIKGFREKFLISTNGKGCQSTKRLSSS